MLETPLEPDAPLATVDNDENLGKKHKYTELPNCFDIKFRESCVDLLERIDAKFNHEDDGPIRNFFV